jgi:hypothetical protein
MTALAPTLLTLALFAAIVGGISALTPQVGK